MPKDSEPKSPPNSPETPQTSAGHPQTSTASDKKGSHFDRKVSISDKPIDLDHVLVNELGEFGRFQLVNLMFVSVPIIMSAFLNEFVFSAGAIPHRCQVPECGENRKNVPFKPAWLSSAIPPAPTPLGFDMCTRYKTTGGTGSLDSCPASLFTSAVQKCDKFVYARDNTVVYDFDLGCSDWLRALAGTLNSVGFLLVMPIAGYVSDRFGRRVALIISVTNVALFGVIRAFSINYTMYLAFELLQTTLGAGLFSSAYIFATEFVGPKYRVLNGATCTSMFAIGQMTVASVAWLFRPWRHMTLALFVPCFLVVVYYWILSESVRWLLSKKRYEEARIVLERVARRNGTQISAKSMNALMNPLPVLIDQADQPPLVIAITRSRVLLRRVCTTPVWWITGTFVYYGLSINATSLSDTIYLNYILTSVIEIPAYYTAAYCLNKIGRRATLSGGFFFSALCNCVFAFIPYNMTKLRLTIYMLGKFGISMVFTSLYLFTSELYPTQYRHSLLSFSSMIGRIGSITAPLTPVLMKYWAGIPSLMFAVMGVISGILVLTQPETLGSTMPDTLEEAEAIGRPELKIHRENVPHITQPTNTTK